MKQSSSWLVLASVVASLFVLGLAAAAQVQEVSFIARRDFAAGSSPLSVVVGDFNGDGLLDLAVANSGSANVSVLINNTRR